MTVLETVKMLLEIAVDDISKDNILNHYIKKATDMALGYCNTDFLPETYNGTLADFAVFLYNNRDMEGISRKTEGEISVSMEGAIPKAIRLALPLPKIKVGCGNVL